MCRSTNRQPDPEVWFRILHIAQEGHDGAPVAISREQTVEIALGPKGAFENGNIGALTRSVPPARVVSAAPQSRGTPKLSRKLRTPHVVEFLRKAIEWRQQLDTYEVRNQTEIARREGITRARVTQIMGMLRLAPEIREQIQTIPDSAQRPTITERMLRPIGDIADHREQLRQFYKFG